jgi:hypothetical protein
MKKRKMQKIVPQDWPLQIGNVVKSGGIKVNEGLDIVPEPELEEVKAEQTGIFGKKKKKAKK